MQDGSQKSPTSQKPDDHFKFSAHQTTKYQIVSEKTKKKQRKSYTDVHKLPKHHENSKTPHPEVFKS